MMTESRDFEAEVIGYIMKHYPIRVRWFRPEVKQVTKEWTLLDDFEFVPEDACDFLSDLFEHFSIEHSNFDVSNYLEREYPFWQKIPSPEPEVKPLTVQMIIESAQAGKWLFD